MNHIGRDFQGWPIDAMTLEDILKHLGFTENEDSWSISKDAPILKAYPRILEDDGMGYGVNPEFITEADDDIYEDEARTFEYKPITEGQPFKYKKVYDTEKIQVFNIFRERVHPEKLDDE